MTCGRVQLFESVEDFPRPEPLVDAAPQSSQNFGGVLVLERLGLEFAVEGVAQAQNGAQLAMHRIPQAGFAECCQHGPHVRRGAAIGAAMEQQGRGLEQGLLFGRQEEMVRNQVGNRPHAVAVAFQGWVLGRRFGRDQCCDHARLPPTGFSTLIGCTLTKV